RERGSTPSPAARRPSPPSGSAPTSSGRCAPPAARCSSSAPTRSSSAASTSCFWPSAASGWWSSNRSRTPSTAATSESSCCRAEALPVDRHLHPAAAGRHDDVSLAAAEQIDVAQDLDVAPAVLGHPIELPRPDPFEALQPVGRLARAEGLLSHVAE